jgi:hypothetical protein
VSVVIRYLTLAAAVGGMGDTGQFLLARRHLFRENRRRASGTAMGVAMWSALALSAALDRRTGRRTMAVASAVGVANAALLAVHLRSGLLSPRIFVGPALAVAALGSSVAGYKYGG